MKVTTKMHVADALQDCLCFDQCEPTFFYGLIKVRKHFKERMRYTKQVSNECRISQLTAH